MLRFPAAVLLALVMVACASTTPFVVTGQTIKQSGLTFLETAKLYDTLYDQKKITAKQYNEWKVVGKKYQDAYPVAERLWNTARASNDVVLEKASTDALAHLMAELARFALAAAQYRSTQ